MALDFIKKLFKKEKIDKNSKSEPVQSLRNLSKEEHSDAAETQNSSNLSKEEVSRKTESKVDKPLSEKTDEDLEKELLEYSPEILSQAKTPQMRKMIVNIYRKMLEDKVDINNEKDVRKWLQKHPEVAQGGEPLPKPETYKREAPKVGRNDPCPCGSGKKYKKCCGK